MLSVESSTPAALLKQETAPAHQRTEKALVARIKAIAGPNEYCSLLACLYGYFSPLEQLLDPVLSGFFPDYTLRRKSGRLLSDIHALEKNHPLRFSRPELADPSGATALGFAYVMEGSVLGGIFIKKMISARFPEIPDQAYSFFSGYGEENRNMWNAFLDVLNRELSAPGKTAEGLKAADTCFTGMEWWINSWYETPGRDTAG